MKVQFLRDYRGKLTAEAYYVAGSEASFSDPVAQALVDRGAAAFVAEPEPVVVAPKPVQPKPAPKRRRR